MVAVGLSRLFSGTARRKPTPLRGGGGCSCRAGLEDVDGCLEASIGRLNRDFDPLISRSFEVVEARSVAGKVG
jgi:hypothetical protein